jgi:hypothetical protein
VALVALVALVVVGLMPGDHDSGRVGHLSR